MLQRLGKEKRPEKGKKNIKSQSYFVLQDRCFERFYFKRIHTQTRIYIIYINIYIYVYKYIYIYILYIT